MPRLPAPPPSLAVEREKRAAKLPEKVKVTVLAAGEGLVYTGDLEPVSNQPTVHCEGETLVLDKSIALALEKRGYVKIEA